MNITEVNNLKQFDIIEKRDRDGYVHVGMITSRCLQGTNVYEVMFETVDNGVEFRWYSIVNLYDFNKV
jgi:hypothetical protein